MWSLIYPTTVMNSWPYPKLVTISNTRKLSNMHAHTTCQYNKQQNNHEWIFQMANWTRSFKIINCSYSCWKFQFKHWCYPHFGSLAVVVSDYCQLSLRRNNWKSIWMGFSVGELKWPYAKVNRMHGIGYWRLCKAAIIIIYSNTATSSYRIKSLLRKIGTLRRRRKCRSDTSPLILQMATPKLYVRYITYTLRCCRYQSNGNIISSPAHNDCHCLTCE